jgi:hypothetical protein
LQRADASGTAGRAAIFNRASHQFTCCWRPTWIPGSKGGGRWWFSWWIWQAGTSGPPVATHIRRRDLRGPRNDQAKGEPSAYPRSMSHVRANAEIRMASEKARPKSAKPPR